MEDVNCLLCFSCNKRELYSFGMQKVVKCESCGFVYLSPRKTLEELSRFYESDYYDDYQNPSEMERNKLRCLVEKLHTFVRSGVLCDVGCSVGNLLSAAQKYYRIEGVEISSRACRFAKEIHGLDIANTSLVQRAFDDSSLDIVTCIEVIEHLTEVRAFVDEVARVLRPGGMFFVTTGNIESWQAKLHGKNWWYFQPEYHLSYFSPFSLGALLAKDFDVVLTAGNWGLQLSDVPNFSKEIDNTKTLFKEIVARLNVGGRYVGSTFSVYAIKKADCSASYINIDTKTGIEIATR